MNIQQQNISEVDDTEIVMSDNEELYPPPTQDISNVFATADLLSRSSSDSAKYKRTWLKAKKSVLLFYLLGNFQTHAVWNYPLH